MSMNLVRSYVQSHNVFSAQVSTRRCSATNGVVRIGKLWIVSSVKASTSSISVCLVFITSTISGLACGVEKVKIYFTIATKLFAFVTKLFAFVTKLFAIVTKWFAIVTKWFVIVTKLFAFVTKLFAIVTKWFAIVTKWRSCFKYPWFRAA